ncbi:hypothetical protein ACFOHY_05400 [Rhizobium rosettiformans]
MIVFLLFYNEMTATEAAVLVSTLTLGIVAGSSPPLVTPVRSRAPPPNP